ncbi:hypothetical protein [Erythrobacter sp. EC-HK427]|uniref:hypothetical protein n=1 Tax=Erythrobacter sp. EC-HK427 TaxID=2038396 RepID=UPI0018FE75C6|nr:hypothetical protein [Erythrobacter sp. EC-HK427]
MASEEKAVKAELGQIRILQSGLRRIALQNANLCAPSGAPLLFILFLHDKMIWHGL